MVKSDIENEVEKLMVIYRNHTIDGQTSMEGMAMLLTQFTEVPVDLRSVVSGLFEEEVRGLEA
jgi:hypothetical protein